MRVTCRCRVVDQSFKYRGGGGGVFNVQKSLVQTRWSCSDPVPVPGARSGARGAPVRVGLRGAELGSNARLARLCRGGVGGRAKGTGREGGGGVGDAGSFIKASNLQRVPIHEPRAAARPERGGGGARASGPGPRRGSPV